MAKMTVPIDVRGIDQVKTMIELLERHMDALPEELRTSLRELADCKQCEFGPDEFFSMAGASNQDVETDFHTTMIISANKILKRVIWLDDSGTKHEEYPERFRIGAAGRVFLQWGHDG